jgi:5'-3' exoribonuclease 2
MELITPGRGHLAKETRELTHSMVVNRGAVYRANMENKSAAAILKSKLMKGPQDEPAGETPATEGEEKSNAAEPTSPSVLGKRKADEAEQQDTESGTPGRDSPPPAVPEDKPKGDEMPEDTVKLWEPGYADRYYEQKFGVDPKDIEFRHKVARAYAEGLAWVLRYYFQGCPSQGWYYPYHYAPLYVFHLSALNFEVCFGLEERFANTPSLVPRTLLISPTWRLTSRRASHSGHLNS